MENTVRAQDKDLKHQHATVRRFGLDTSHQRFATVVRVLHPLEILRNETGPIHRETRAFVGSNALLIGLLVTGAAAIFPVMLYSTLAPENSLTAYAVAAGRDSLLFASIWWPAGFALAVVYFVFISRRYAGKVSVRRDTQGFY